MLSERIHHYKQSLPWKPDHKPSSARLIFPLKPARYLPKQRVNDHHAKSVAGIRVKVSGEAPTIVADGNRYILVIGSNNN